MLMINPDLGIPRRVAVIALWTAAITAPFAANRGEEAQNDLSTQGTRPDPHPGYAVSGVCAEDALATIDRMKREGSSREQIQDALDTLSVNNERASIEQSVDRFLKPLVEENLFSGSVLISRQGSVLLAKGYGSASREHDVPNDVNSVFFVASVTKAFTAAAILLLEDRGLLSVEDTLGVHLQGYPRGDEITIHHLLTHTSGIPSYQLLPGPPSRYEVTHSLEEMIGWFKDEPLRNEPGEQFAYSNSGYLLLTKIIENVSGMSYAEFVRKNIFQPAGMTHTHVPSDGQILRNRSFGYSRAETGEIIRRKNAAQTSQKGDGSIHSTVMDLYRWDQALISNRLLTRESRDKMWTAMVHTPWGDDYGYGFFVGEWFGRRVIHQEGGTTGYMATVVRFLDDDVLLVCLMNYDLIIADEVQRSLAAIAVGKLPETLFRPRLEKDTISDLALKAGVYDFGEDPPLTLSVESDRAFIQIEGQPRWEISLTGAGRLFVKELNARLRFPGTEEDENPRIIIQQGAIRWEGRRVQRPAM